MMRRVLSATLSTKQRMMKSQFTYSQKSSFSTLTRLGQQPKVVDTTTTNTNTTTQTAETNDPTASNPDFDRNDPEGRPFGKWLMNTYITFAAIAIVTFSVGFVWNQFDRSTKESIDSSKNQAQAARRAAILDRERDDLEKEIIEGRDSIVNKLKSTQQQQQQQ